MFFSEKSSHNSPIVMVGSTVIGSLAIMSEILVCSNTSVARLEFKLSNNSLALKNLITSVEVKIPNYFLAALEMSASPPTIGILLNPFLTIILHSPSKGVPGVVVNTLGLM